MILLCQFIFWSWVAWVAISSASDALSQINLEKLAKRKTSTPEL